MKNRNEYHWNWCSVGEWGKIDQEHLRELFESKPQCRCNDIPSTMPFIRLSWLLGPKTKLTNLPAMEDLPPEAFIFPDEMAECYFVSHRWLESDHPDRTGEQIAVAISRMWAYHQNPVSVSDWTTVPRVHKTGIWYDYLCLPQKTVNEELLSCVFQLPKVTIPLVVLNGDRQFSSRAWCVAEAVAGSMNSRTPYKLISLSVQSLRYKGLTSLTTPTEDLLKDKKRWGYFAGITKLRQWLFETETIATISDEILKAEGMNWKRCTDVVSDLVFNVIGGQKLQERAFSEDELLYIAQKYNLKTTKETDLLTCMRAISGAMDHSEH